MPLAAANDTLSPVNDPGPQPAATWLRLANSLLRLPMLVLPSELVQPLGQKKIQSFVRLKQSLFA